MLLLLASLAVAADLDPILRMEEPGWQPWPRDAVTVDLESQREGRRALTLSLGPDASGQATLTREIPFDVVGRKVRLEGWVRIDSLEDGDAGLFLRGGGRIWTDTARSGKEGWQRLKLKARVDEDFSIGAYLEGEGSVTFDELTLSVDGVPWDDAPRQPPLGWTLDHRFDDGSGVEPFAPTEAQRARLVRLARVWGFVKVHHPAVRAGDVNIDYELFEVLPAVIAAQDPAAVDAALVAWIEGLGELAPCDPCAKVPEDAILRPDLDWIEGDGALEALLREVHAARGGRHHLVSLTRGVGNPDFSKELAFADVDPLDPGHRLLAVFRFWNTIEWWFPYRDLVQGDWQAALSLAIDEALRATDKASLARALIRLHVPVHDTHTNLWGGLEHREPTGACAVDADVRFLGDEAVVWRGEALERGDVVQSVGGVPVDDLVARWSPWFAASNEPTRRRGLARSLLVADCGPVSVAVQRGEDVVEVETVAIERKMATTHDRPGEAFQMLGDDIAYLKLGGVKGAEIGAYLERAEGTRGWILDLRNYPSDFVVFALGAHFVEEPTPFVRFSIVDPSNPGTFRLGPPLELKPQAPFYEGRVAILVDEMTQSSAEYHAMAFGAHPSARVFGSTTAGADGNVSRLALPGGWRSAITGIGVFHPDGSPTQQVGIVPDVTVVPTVAGVREGRDEVIEAAEAWIRGE